MDNNQLKDITTYNIEKSIISAFSNNDEFVKLIHVMSRFYLYDYKNVVLIYKQIPEASVIAGMECADNMGLKLSGSEQKVALLYPVFKLEKEGKILKDASYEFVEVNTGANIYEEEPEYTTDYKVVTALDLSDLVKDTPEDGNDLINKIKYITGFSIRGGLKSELSEHKVNVFSPDGFFDSEKKEIVISEDILNNPNKSKLLDKTLLDLYIDYENIFSYQMPNDDFSNQLTTIIKLIVRDHFGIKVTGSDVNVLLSEIPNDDLSYLNRLLERASKYSSEAIMDLSTHSLRFNEIAICNSLLRTDDFAKMNISFLSVGENIKDEILREEIRYVSEMLHLTKDGYLTKLNDTVKNKKLYSYPPYEIDFLELESEALNGSN